MSQCVYVCGQEVGEGGWVSVCACVCVCLYSVNLSLCVSVSIFLHET